MTTKPVNVNFQMIFSIVPIPQFFQIKNSKLVISVYEMLKHQCQA